MTPLELILLAIIWINVGCFICHKRKWFSEETLDDARVLSVLTIAFTPITLIVALFRVFIVDDWKNE